MCVAHIPCNIRMYPIFLLYSFISPNRDNCILNNTWNSVLFCVVRIPFFFCRKKVHAHCHWNYTSYIFACILWSCEIRFDIFFDLFGQFLIARNLVNKFHLCWNHEEVNLELVAVSEVTTTWVPSSSLHVTFEYCICVMRMWLPCFCIIFLHYTYEHVFTERCWFAFICTCTV